VLPSSGGSTKPNLLGPLDEANLNPIDPTNQVVYFHLMTEAQPASET
jgi:hypothetical protein